MGFRDRKQFGQAAETAIATYLRQRGFSVMPIYERLDDEKKGPQIFLPEGSLVAPDLLVFRGADVYWIEAKHKRAFSWHRATQRWVTGIDRCYFDDYCILADQSPWPVWLFFLHLGGQCKDSPSDSPSGLFGADLAYLRHHVNHTSENWGPHGMVYWSHETLRQIAALPEVMF